MRILYPGTFDPLTFGHLDLIERANSLFGNVTVAILENSNKSPTFDIDRRIIQIEKSTSYLNSVDIVTFQGLTVDCAKKYNADLILRGLRALSDFEYELQLAHTNRSLDNNIETIFLATEANNSFLSSSVVKEVAKFGGKISHMVPKIIVEDLENYYS